MSGRPDCEGCPSGVDARGADGALLTGTLVALVLRVLARPRDLGTRISFVFPASRPLDHAILRGLYYQEKFGHF